MTTSAAGASTTEPMPGGDKEALQYLHSSVAQGTHWFTALLETVALWQCPEETYQERTYSYLIGGEAFDWLLLAERLCEELGDIVPHTEKEALLFFGRFPTDISPWEFQRIIGRSKFRSHLNFWYGVLVEEAIILAMEERVAKDRASSGIRGQAPDPDLPFLRIYGTTQEELLAQYQQAQGLPRVNELSQRELQAFTYWCFKYRLNHEDPAKVASDTRLGLQQLQRMQIGRLHTAPF